jgi:hypothetical protein
MSNKPKMRLLGKQVWCVVCIVKVPVIIRKSDYLVPVRKGHYDFVPGTSDIDNRVMGICSECLSSLNDFQRRNTLVVDIDHPNLIHKNI